MISEVEHGNNLLPRNSRIQCKELINRLPALQKVDQTLHRDTGTSEARGSTQALRTHPHRFVEPGLLIGSHNLRISVVRREVMRFTALRSDKAFLHVRAL